jgi:hypothetical protein
MVLKPIWSQSLKLQIFIMRSEDATCQSIVRMSIDHLINNQHERWNNLFSNTYLAWSSLLKKT